jgi:hypothetical protein
MGESDELADFFNISEDLVELRQIKQIGSASLDFDGLLASPLQLHEDLTNGCGGQLWPAGMVLAKYMLRQPPAKFSDKSM